MGSKIKSVITVALAVCMLASCNLNPQNTDESTEPTGEPTFVLPTPTPTPEPEPDPVFPVFRNKVGVPKIEESEDITKPVTFYLDGEEIKGKITYPEGKGPFKTIIISGGLYTNLGRYTKKAKRYSQEGYCVIEFKFRNGTAPNPYKDPKYLGDFIYEQVKDLNAIVDSTRFIPQVDQSNIYLYGHSMGGLVTAYVGAMRPQDVKGLLLCDPSYYALKRMKFENGKTITTDLYPHLAKCNFNVLIITGGSKSFGKDQHVFDDAMANYPNANMVIIEGADHHFDGTSGDKVVDRSVEIMRYWDAKERLKQS